MKKYLPVLTFLLSIDFSESQTTAFDWVKQISGPNNEYAYDLDSDSDGNIYISGVFGYTDGGDGTFGDTTLSTHGNGDAFVCKLDPNGNVIWVRSMGGTEQDRCWGVAVDGAGNVNITGRFYNTALVEDTSITSAGGEDIFIIQYDSSGNLNWLKRIGDVWGDEGQSIAVDTIGNVYVKGKFSGTVIIDDETLYDNGNGDVLFAKFDINGNLQWVKQIGGSESDGDWYNQWENNVVVNSVGEIIIGMSFQGTMDYEGNSLVTNGEQDILIAKYDSAGNLLWYDQIGGPDTERPRYLEVDNNDNVIAICLMEGDIIEPFSMPLLFSPREKFVVKYDSTGNLLWANHIGGTSGTISSGLAIDNQNQILISGLRSGGIPLIINESLLPVSDDDQVTYLALLDEDGFLIGYEHALSTFENWAMAAEYSSLNRMYITGGLKETNTFGDTTLFSTGERDVYYGEINVANLTDVPPPFTISSVADVPDDQGSRVFVSWESCPLDTFDLITQYGVWSLDNDGNWFSLGNVPSIHTDETYTFLAQTLGDSTQTDGIHWSIFRITAHTTWNHFYESPIDSGYSLDNIAPGVPGGLLLAATDEGLMLSWNQSADEDFQYFIVYKSADSLFQTDQYGTYTTADAYFVDSEYEIGIVYYRVSAVDHAGNEGEYSEVISTSILETDQEDLIPTEFALRQNYPNPFNPTTQIKYDLPEDALVAINIYDMMGRSIKSLVNSQQTAGYRSIQWDATNNLGEPVSAGMYIYMIQAGQYQQTKKMVLLK